VEHLKRKVKNEEEIFHLKVEDGSLGHSKILIMNKEKTLAVIFSVFLSHISHNLVIYLRLISIVR